MRDQINTERVSINTKTHTSCEARRLLLEIKDLSGKKSSQIAPILGVHYETIRKCEYENFASKHLLAGLELLLANIKAKQRIAELEQALRTMQTVHTGHFEMNKKESDKNQQTRKN